MKFLTLKCIAIFLFVAFYPSFLEAKSVAIIGGGMAGIASAVFLEEGFDEVHLFEKEEAPGGHAQTVEVPNENGDLIPVDLGPQYFAERGWDLYIDFLKYLNLYDEDEITPFESSLTIFSERESIPWFFSPRPNTAYLNFLRHSPKRLPHSISLVDFFSELYGEYKTDSKEPLPIDKVLDRLFLRDKYKDQVIRPILASVGNTDVQGTHDLDAIGVAEVIAFRHPLAQSEFLVSNAGMGQLLQRVVRQLTHTNVHCQTPIQRITPLKNGRFRLLFNHNETQEFDYVILAIHPRDMKGLLKDFGTPVLELLPRFTYAKQRLVLHYDSSFVHSKFLSFQNLLVRNNGTVVTTMNLSKIDKRYKGIYKTWADDKAYERLVRKNRILAETTYFHPIPNVEFQFAVKDLKNALSSYHHLQVAGGWSQGLETQATAIRSAFFAVKAFDLNLAKKWAKRLSNLNEN